MIFDLEMLKRLVKEDAVKTWFDETELTHFIEDEMKQNKSIKPDWDYTKSKYVSNYILHCPIFYQLTHSNDEEAIKMLWQIKNFERKLAKSGLKSVNCTYTKCLSCKGRNGKKACER